MAKKKFFDTVKAEDKKEEETIIKDESKDSLQVTKDELLLEEKTVIGIVKAEEIKKSHPIFIGGEIFLKKLKTMRAKSKRINHMSVGF